MNIIVRYVSKNIRSNRKSSILIFLLLSVLSFILYNCIGIDKNIEKKYQGTLREIYGECDIVVKSNEDDGGYEELKNKLSDNAINCDILKMNCAINTFSFDLSPRFDKQFIVLNTDFAKAYSLKMFPEFELKENEAAITETTCDELNLSMGVNIDFTDKSGDKKTFTLSDSIPNKYFFKNNNKIPYLIVSDEVWEKITCSNVMEYYYIDVPDDMISKSIQILEEEDLDVSKLIDEKTIKESCSSIKKMFWIILVLVFLICFFIINSITKLIDYERKEAIGTFRSIGSTIPQTIRVFLVENALYGLCGGVIGGLIAVLSENTITDMFLSGNTASTERASALTVGLKFLLTVGLTIFSNIIMSFYLVYNKCRRNIKEMVIEKKEKKYEPSLPAFIIGGLMLAGTAVLMNVDIELNFGINILMVICITCGIALILPFVVKIFSVIIEKTAKWINLYVLNVSSRNIRSNSVIVNNIKIICILSILMLTINVVANSFGSFVTSKIDIYSCDYIISEMTSESEAQNYFDVLSSEKDVKFAELYSDMNEIKINGKTEVNATIVSDWKNDSLYELFEGIKYESENFPELKDNEVVMDKKICEYLNIKIGDSVRLSSDSGDDKEYKLVDMCTSDFWNNHKYVFVISHDEFVKNYGNIPSNIYVKTNDSSFEYIGKLLESKKTSIDTIINNVRKYKSMERESNKDTLAIVNFVMFIGMGLGLICVTSNQIISFYHRTRELAVLYSTSMGINQIKKMLLYEIFLSVIISSLFSMIGVYMLIWAINNLVNLLNLNVKMKLVMSDVMIYVSAIGLLVVITSLLPIRKLNKFDVIKAIKYE